MPFPTNPQRVPLVEVINGQYMITREWVKILQELTGQTSSPGAISVESLLGMIGALTARVLTLEAAVEELRLGYHL